MESPDESGDKEVADGEKELEPSPESKQEPMEVS